MKWDKLLAGIILSERKEPSEAMILQEGEDTEETEFK